MHIGITFDPSESAETLNALSTSLGRLGHKPSLIGNSYDLGQQLAEGNRWDLVFNTSCGIQGVRKESQIPSTLDLYQIPCTFADAFSLSIALTPVARQSLVQEAGIPSTEIPLVGRKLIVGIVGNESRTKIIGVIDHSSRRTNTHADEKTAQTALAVWRLLGGRDAGLVHLRMDATGTPHFVGIDLLASFNPDASDLVTLCRVHGFSYCDLVRMVVEEASIRHSKNSEAQIFARVPESYIVSKVHAI